MLRKAVLLSLLSFTCLHPFECTAYAASADEARSSAVASARALEAEQPAVISLGPDGMPLDASWEERYVKETRITIENNVTSVMRGLATPDDLAVSVLMLCRTWDDWAQSKLFNLDDARDIDVYGNLYSFMVMCRTLRLAAEDWQKQDDGREAQEVFNKSLWLEKKSRRLAEPVGEIIKNQSYSSFLPRRVEVMEEQFKYVDECYKRRPFSEVLR
ncbi:hypothetical protein [Mailhella sp.]|uniref:hypothetical protein n=1 Tax=Mailhella sp. TaxID=1981029 RepID=UPI00406335BB